MQRCTDENLILKTLNTLIWSCIRLYYQKGLDLLLSILPEILAAHDASFVILGSGDEKQENEFSDLADSFPDKNWPKNRI